MIPSQDASSRGWAKRAKSPISAISPSAVSVAIPRNPVSALDLADPRSRAGDLLELAVERVELASRAVEVEQHLLKRDAARAGLEPLARDPRACIFVQAFFPSR